MTSSLFVSCLAIMLCPCFAGSSLNEKILSQIRTLEGIIGSIDFGNVPELYFKVEPPAQYLKPLPVASKGGVKSKQPLPESSRAPRPFEYGRIKFWIRIDEGKAVYSASVILLADEREVSGTCIYHPSSDKPITTDEVIRGVPCIADYRTCDLKDFSGYLADRATRLMDHARKSEDELQDGFQQLRLQEADSTMNEENPNDLYRDNSPSVASKNNRNSLPAVLPGIDDPADECQVNSASLGVLQGDSLRENK